MRIQIASNKKKVEFEQEETPRLFNETTATLCMERPSINLRINSSLKLPKLGRQSRDAPWLLTPPVTSYSTECTPRQNSDRTTKSCLKKNVRQRAPLSVIVNQSNSPTINNWSVHGGLRPSFWSPRLNRPRARARNLDMDMITAFPYLAEHQLTCKTNQKYTQSQKRVQQYDFSSLPRYNLI